MRSPITALVLLVASCSFGKNIGFGIGQTIGEHLLTPSLFTMRIPLGQSMVVAPEVNFQYNSSDETVDSINGSAYTIGMESNFYYSVARREETAFYAIAGMGVEFSREVSEWYEHDWYPEPFTTKVKQTTSISSQGLNLGLGLERSFTDNLSLLICTLSNLTRTTEKVEEKRNGETEVLEDVSDWSLDFQNLKYCVYLIWYL